MRIPLLSSVFGMVRRKRRIKDEPDQEKHKKVKQVLSGSIKAKKMDSMSTGTSFKASVLWKADGRCYIRDLLLCHSLIDNSYWILIKHHHYEHQIHNSNNLIDISYEPDKPIAHFSFVTGLLSVRFSSTTQLNELRQWIMGKFRPRGSGIFAQLNCRSMKEGSGKNREIRIMIKESSMVIVDEKRQRPIVFGSIQQFKNISIRGHDVIMSSRAGQEFHFICGRSAELRAWTEQAQAIQNSKKHTSMYRIAYNRKKKPRSVLSNRKRTGGKHKTKSIVSYAEIV